jgi:DnaK suppressor protein
MIEEAILQALRGKLLQRRHELLDQERAGEQARQTVELDQARVGRLSRMDALQGQAMAAETQRRRQAALRRISSALQRMEQDEYGYCLECGEEIARGRLELDPATPLCIACASKAEKDTGHR